jgi:hypothetical protein
MNTLQEKTMDIVEEDNQRFLAFIETIENDEVQEWARINRGILLKERHALLKAQGVIK